MTHPTDQSPIEAPGTYTIAIQIGSGMLIACVPDGGDLNAAIGDAADQLTVEIDRDSLIVESGLVLTDEPTDADDVRYRGFDLGRLQAAQTEWRYAVRRTA